MRFRNLRLAGLLVVSYLLAGCTAAAFVAANVSSTFGPFERHAGIAYGTEPRQRLDVYVPDGPSAEPHPVMVFFHGGSWQTGSKDQYRFVGSSLAETGYVTVVANYRLHPEVDFPLFVTDAADAVAWTLRNISQYGGDPGRVFVMGHSSGAHMALLLALDPRYLEAAGASTDDLRGAIGLSGPYNFRIDSGLLQSVFSSAPDPADTQPIHFARRGGPPLLLIHGTNDEVCWASNSIQLTARVREAGGEAELHLYPGVGHGATIAGLSRPGRTYVPTLEAVAAFVAARPGNPPKPQRAAR